MELNWVDAVLRLIPETFVFIWGIYTISNKAINKKRHIVYCILISIEIYIFRLLPIHFGVHTIIDNIFIICLLLIEGFSTSTAIRNTLLITLLVLIGEFFNIILLKILNINIEAQFKIPGGRSLIMLPSLLLFILLIYLIKFFLIKKKGRTNVIS